MMTTYKERFLPTALPTKGNDTTMFKVGQRVIKTGGSYTFNGIVVAVFHKRSGSVRLVVENPEGILHIFSEKNLVLLPFTNKDRPNDVMDLEELIQIVGEKEEQEKVIRKL